MACTFFIGASQTNVKAISCRKSSYSCYRRRSIDENCGVSENRKSDVEHVAIPEITQSVKLAQRNVTRRNYISRCRVETLHYARKRTSLAIFFKLLSPVLSLFVGSKAASFLCIAEPGLFLGMLNSREMSLKISTHS